MVFIKRLLTALVLLGLLFVVLRGLALGVGGGVMGAKASATLQQQRGPGAPLDFQEAARTGAQAGLKFQQDYGSNVSLAALGVATVAALWLSFGGVLPWCRETKPPPIPTTQYYNR